MIIDAINSFLFFSLFFIPLSLLFTHLSHALLVFSLVSNCANTYKHLPVVRSNSYTTQFRTPVDKYTDDKSFSVGFGRNVNNIEVDTGFVKHLFCGRFESQSEWGSMTWAKAVSTKSDYAHLNPFILVKIHDIIIAIGFCVTLCRRKHTKMSSVKHLLLGEFNLVEWKFNAFLISFVRKFYCIF